MLSHPDQDVVRRDAALPGLATVLDIDATLDVLRQIRPDLGYGCATITYVRYKPGISCLVGFRIVVNGEAILLNVQARRPDQHDKLAKAVRKPGVSGPFGPGRIVIHELALVISVFPNDRRLPDLKRLTDPDEMRTLVSEFGGIALASTTRLELLHYRPERRCVARLVSDAGPVALVKIHAKGAFARACCNAQAFTSSEQLIVPAFLGGSAGSHAVAVKWVRGEVWIPTRMSAAPIGTALASLHAQAPDLSTTLTRQAQVCMLRTQTRDLSRLWPPLSGRAWHIARRLGAALLEETGILCPIHGDFYSDQVLIAGDCVGIIDLDEAASGSPAWDLGNFIGHLHYRNLAGAIEGKSPEAIGQDLIDGYRSAGGRPSLREVRLQTAVALMRLAARPFRERHPQWPDRMAVIMQQVEILLADTAAFEADDITLPAELIDPAMPLIERALDRTEATRHFAPLALGKGQWRIEEASLVRHKPGRRCLIEYRLTAGADDGGVVLGKMRARGADHRAYALQRELWGSTFGPAAADGIMVSEAIAIVPELGMWLQRKSRGRPLPELLHPATVPEPSRIALAIAKLHRSGVAARRRHTIGDELRILDERLSGLVHRRPEWADRVDALSKAAIKLARGATPGEECGIHRDFYPDHVLIDQDKLILLDLDLYSAGDPAVDVGNFLAHVIEHGLRLRGTSDFLVEWRAEFEAAYRRLNGKISTANIRIYEMLTLMRLIEISTRMPERQSFARLLLEDCENRLEATLAGKE